MLIEGYVQQLYESLKTLFSPIVYLRKTVFNFNFWSHLHGTLCIQILEHCCVISTISVSSFIKWYFMFDPTSNESYCQLCRKFPYITAKAFQDKIKTCPVVVENKKFFSDENLGKIIRQCFPQVIKKQATGTSSTRPTWTIASPRGQSLKFSVCQSSFQNQASS